MTAEGAPTGDWALLRKLVPFLRPYSWLYGIALVAAPASALLAVVQPWLLKIAIDRYIVPGDVAGIQRAALWYLGAVVAAFLLEAIYTLAISYAATLTIAGLRDAVFARTLSFGRSFFDRQPTGRLLTRTTSDVEALGETLSAGAITIVLDVILVLGVVGAMLALDARLTLVLLLVAPPLAFFVDQVRRVLRRLYATVRTSLSDLNAFTAERLTGLDVVQLYSDETRTLAGFDRRLGRYRDATVRTNLWDALLYATVDGVSSITVALMLWYGSGGLLDGVVTAGLLAAFVDYVARLFRPIQEFSAKIAVLQRATTALEKIFGLLEHEEHVTEGDVALPTVRGDLRLEEVSFAYGDGPDVLRDVSLAIRPGETVALVGRTGSGKTTIGKLLTRAYDGFRGRILVEGHDVATLRLADLRRQVGVVLQDVQLFPGTVRFNLTLGHPIEDDRLEEAIRVARAEDVVERLGGLDGWIAHRGGNVSVGEAQLLSFARTLAHDPPVVILDEATASVDSLTEARIQAATEAVLARKTVLVIAHRLSTIVHADRIVVTDAGRIVEIGRHDDLLARDGVYARLFRQQFEHGSGDARVGGIAAG